ncbi:MAG: hypothetical protein WBE50_00060 [Methyloceanibacter sp.]
MRREPCFREHAPGVATDCKSLPSLDQVVTVELERVGLLGKRSFVKDSLAIILARCLEVIELEQPIGGGEEFRRAQFLLHSVIGDLDLAARDEAGIEEACSLRHRQEVIPIERAAKALSVEFWIGPDTVGKAPITIDIGKVKLATRLL